MNKTDLYELVTQKIVAMLEAGVVPWQIPWRSQNGMPRNLLSNRPYSGINFWMLLCLKFDSPFYLTFEQARALGGSVRKGEKATLVVFWKILESTEKDGSTKKTPFLRYYNVFNLSQTEGIDPTKIPETEAFDHDFNPIGTADEIIQNYPAEERIYRMRCVEGWSIVVPWNGFPLHRLLADADVQPEAKFIAFTTVLRPDQMPGQNDPSYPWPYTEGLRLDEANHDLTLLASGIYGKPMPKQDGAPLRLVVPWKYGFKSIKSIVKIEAVADQPPTFWNTISSYEYGFYSNVNPDVPHPRWSQMTERRLGETKRRPTLIFNGYGDQVASLYKGMDLKVNF